MQRTQCFDVKGCDSNPRQDIVRHAEKLCTFLIEKRRNIALLHMSVTIGDRKAVVNVNHRAYDLNTVRRQ